MSLPWPVATGFHVKGEATLLYLFFTSQRYLNASEELEFLSYLGLHSLFALPSLQGGHFLRILRQLRKHLYLRILARTTLASLPPSYHCFSPFYHKTSSLLSIP